MAMTVSAAEGWLVIDQPAVAAPTRTEILLVALVKLGEIGQERAREFLDQQAMLTVACVCVSAAPIWRGRYKQSLSGSGPGRLATSG